MTEAATTTTGYLTDAELVSRTLAGDRDAFNQIVSRYQILICSLAYSRIGQLGQSEDVAQETFITAWKHLRLLRQPEKLRAWLCGIVRNRARKCLRNEGREPLHDAEPLENVPESPAAVALPSDETITREEEAIMWRALERIPELYREPLILFYREHRSIEHVAFELDLTEDAVKQRLSRGRKLLHDEVEAFVEKTLNRTNPTPAFSGAVLAALPLATNSVATASAGAGAAGKGGIAAKGILMACLLPFLGVFTGFGAAWLMHGGRGSRVTKTRLIVTWAIVLGFAVGGDIAVNIASHYFKWSESVSFAAEMGFWFFFYTAMVTWIIHIYRLIQAHTRTAEISRTPTAPVPTLRYATIVAGTHLMMFWGYIMEAWKAQDRLGAGFIVAVMTGLAIWNFFKYRDQIGFGMGRAYVLQIASCAVAVFAIMNLRQDVWLAHFKGISVAELHDRVPFWMVPVLTLLLAVWWVVLLAMTKPKAAELSPAR